MKYAPPPLNSVRATYKTNGRAARCLSFAMLLVCSSFFANESLAQNTIENSLSIPLSFRVYGGPSSCIGSGTYTLISCQTVQGGNTDDLLTTPPTGDVIRRIWIYCDNCATQIGSLSCAVFSSTFTCSSTTYTIEGDFVDNVFRIYQ